MKDKRNPDFVSYTPKYIFYNWFADSLCYFLMILIAYGSYKLYYDIDYLKSETMALVTNGFEFYSYQSMSLSLLFCLFFVAVHYAFRVIFSKYFQKILKSKYKEESVDIQTAFVYKVVTNFYKFCFFTTATFIGFYTLYETEFFFDFRGGCQNFRDFYKKGAPYAYEMKNKEEIGFYYNFNLGFILFDIYLLAIQHLQSDFLIMIVHHMATISLVVFSYSSNSTAIGSMILLILYLGDVYSSFLRIVIYIDVPDYIPGTTAFIFLGVFAYTRMVIFPELIYSGYTYSPRYGITTTCLYGFLTVILLLSTVWLVMITKKLTAFCRTGKIEDIYKVKVSSSPKGKSF